MLNTIVTVLVAALGVHIVAKFAFFALPCARHRKAVDKQYGDKAYAGPAGDLVLMAVTVVAAVLLLWRGVEAVSFLGGLWIGATLLQLYFHQFHRAVPAEHAAPEPRSPLKQMSYAIQDAPWRPWPQIMLLTALTVFSFVLIVTA